MPLLVRRLLTLILSLIIASAVIFAVVDLVPGDPASFMLGTGARPDTIAALREQLGLDLPWPVRYLRWLGGVVTGDLGTSLAYKSPVAGMILDRVQVSLPLALMALALAVAVAFPVGMLAARRRGGGGRGHRRQRAGGGDRGERRDGDRVVGRGAGLRMRLHTAGAAGARPCGRSAPGRPA